MIRVATPCLMLKLYGSKQQDPDAAPELRQPQEPRTRRSSGSINICYSFLFLSMAYLFHALESHARGDAGGPGFVVAALGAAALALAPTPALTLLHQPSQL